MNNLQSSAFVAKTTQLLSSVAHLRLLLVMLLTLTASTAWGATYNFSNIPTSGWKTNGGSQTINGKSWTYSSSTYIGVTSSKIQVGSSKNPQTSNWTIQIPISSFGTNIKITKVSITAYTTATTATYDISVGGSSVKSGSLTTSSSTYSSNTLNATTGNIVVTLKGSSSSKAMYLSNISVTYETATTATYTVTYNANGATSGTVPEDDTNYTSGTTVTVKSNSGTLAKTGHTFGGWNTKADGTGTNYTAGSGTFNITGNTTLYAKWTAKQTNISINANTSNNGSGSGCAVIATYGQALPSFTACTPATGYELVGYYTSATGGTKVIGKDGKLVASVSGYTDANAKWINESASLTLYAQYSAKNYTVTYAGNSGTTSCTGGTYTYNSSFVICLDIPTRTGYSFTGWSDGTNIYQPGANYTMPAKNVTFTAQWQINTYKVKWNVDGSEKEEDVNYNSKPTGAPTIDPNNLPCEGADKFVGWTTGEYKGDSAPTKLYPTADDIPAITEPTTFYAVFADYVNE